MNNMGIHRFFSALSIVVFLIIPAALCASTTILINEEEKKQVEEGDIIIREVTTNNKSGKTFEAIGIINSSRDHIVQVLTAYENYPEFMPNVSNIDIVEQQDHESVLNYTLTLPLGKIKKYRLKISITNPENNYSRVQWQLLDWPELKEEETIQDTNGYWLIEEKNQNSSLVQYHVYTDPGPIPFGLGWIVDVLSKNSVPEALLRTKSRAEKMLDPENRNRD